MGLFRKFFRPLDPLPLPKIVYSDINGEMQYLQGRDVNAIVQNAYCMGVSDQLSSKDPVALEDKQSAYLAQLDRLVAELSEDFNGWTFPKTEDFADPGLYKAIADARKKLDRIEIIARTGEKLSQGR